MPTSAELKISEAFRTLSTEAKELYLSSGIAEIEHAVEPLTFYRDYVSKNIPLVIRGGVNHWPAIDKWSIDYFQDVLSDTLVSVAVTPNGYADAIAEYKLENSDEKKAYFVMPEERKLQMSTFLDKLKNPCADSVFYIQEQNSNFKNEYAELWCDVEDELSWAAEAFGKDPDAVNLWMGDERAVTSMHKDPYENIYCVISGEKNFILHPPTDLPWIPYGKYESAIYKQTEFGWSIERITNNSSDISNFKASNVIPWISIDPQNPDYERYPQYVNANTIKVTVKKGDVLYLPSLWFHHVTQSHACISLNYWYDMEFDIKYAYFKALETLCS